MTTDEKAPPPTGDETPPAPMGAELMLRFQRVMADYLVRQGSAGTALEASLDFNPFLQFLSKAVSDPAAMAESQASFWGRQFDLWSSALNGMMGGERTFEIEQAADDRRFRDPAWTDNDVFHFIKQCYLLSAEHILATVREVEGLDERTARKVQFFTRQFVNALSPENFIATNPQVLRETLDSGGENLVRGLENLLRDMENSKDRFRIAMTDENAFRLGDNIAATPGNVVFRNELLELIQYAPTTEQVFEIPLLIVTPWINKYYVLDLKPENSLIKWAVDQGHTVFVTSWVNPDARLAGKTFDDYAREGLLDGLDAIGRATGETRCNAMGYCLGGTLLAATLGYMAATGDERIHSATFLTTLVDFADPGDLGVFIDERQLAKLEKRMTARGYLDGADMAATFNMLRENDLIWSFVINNYLLGKSPFPFDLLYWNADSTRMPAAMHGFYLREMYLENKLSRPGGLELLGVPVDLTAIRVPTYVLATEDDHIAPWRSTYKAAGLYDGEVSFVLAASGHIAGVVNPPAKGKYGYWEGGEIDDGPEAWLDGASHHDGSWWPHWADWIGKRAGAKTQPPRILGSSLCDAPGTYVRVRSG